MPLLLSPSPSILLKNKTHTPRPKRKNTQSALQDKKYTPRLQDKKTHHASQDKKHTPRPKRKNRTPRLKTKNTPRPTTKNAHHAQNTHHVPKQKTRTTPHNKKNTHHAPKQKNTPVPKTLILEFLITNQWFYYLYCDFADNTACNLHFPPPSVGEVSNRTHVLDLRLQSKILHLRSPSSRGLFQCPSTLWRPSSVSGLLPSNKFLSPSPFPQGRQFSHATQSHATPYTAPNHHWSAQEWT